MKKPVLLFFVLLTAVLLCILSVSGQIKNIKNIADIHIRDPYILADEATGTYYMYQSMSYRDSIGKEVGGVGVSKSKNLKTWEGPVKVFSVPSDNWITGRVWAPEVHEYKGKYYLFATLNSDIEWKKEQPNWPKFTFRGTQIFWSDSPEGPFKPFSRLPHTPMDRMALDGTLWIEDGKPYMVYCHEWVQIADGTMELVELADDLSIPVGKSVTLFCASAADWSTGTVNPAPLPVSYVTDGCFLYKTKTGKLLMIWSSFMNGEYALGIAESATGKITGPWKQQKKPLFSQNGGHGMIFRTFDGKLCITFHGPNSPGGAERAHIFEIEDTGDSLKLKREITGAEGMLIFCK